jgi:pimeloyl-ACP methyl ester carboxylesterase
MTYRSSHRRVRATLFAPLAALALLAFTGATGAALGETDSPSKKECKELIQAYLAIGGRSEAGLAERADIRKRLAGVELTRKSDLKSWRKHLLKTWASGPELETESVNYLWPDARRGKYLIGGELKKPGALAICMHGGGLGSGEASSAKAGYEAAMVEMGWLAVYPEVLEKTECGWTDAGTEEFVLELVDRALRTWDIDHDRVYLVGHSMGGYGSWTLGAHHADRVAALGPSAGGPSPLLGPDGQARDIVPGVIPSLRNVPLVIYQSADDPKVPPDANRVAVKKLEEARARWGGFDFEYWEVNGRGHGAPPGGYVAHLQKIAAFERGPLPTKVVWQPELAWKQQFYWLWWEKPRAKVVLEAEIDRESGTCDVRADKAAYGVSLLLNEELVDMKRELLVRFNGKEVWRGVPARSLDVLVSTAVHGDERLMFEARIQVTR